MHAQAIWDSLSLMNLDVFLIPCLVSFQPFCLQYTFFSLSLLIWDFHNSLLFLLIMSQSVLLLFLIIFFSFHSYDRIISNDLPFSSLILSSPCLNLLLKYFIIFFHTVFYFSALVFIVLIFFVELLILFMHFPPEFHVVVCPCFLHFTKLL